MIRPAGLTLALVVGIGAGAAKAQTPCENYIAAPGPNGAIWIICTGELPAIRLCQYEDEDTTCTDWTSIQ